MVDKVNCGNDFSQFPLKKEYSFVSDLKKNFTNSLHKPPRLGGMRIEKVLLLPGATRH
jgi:hypothetical protein